VKHEEVWQRLPDLLEDRDDPELLDHVRGCADCQRQLFLLGRVDRLLRDRAQVSRPRRAWRRPTAVVAAAALAVAVGLGAVLLVSGGSSAHELAFRTASGRLVGHVSMTHADTHNVSLALVARRLPATRRHMFVLWAADGGASMEVGPFMVDRSGGCRVSFNVPANHDWSRFWIAPPGEAGSIVAST